MNTSLSKTSGRSSQPSTRHEWGRPLRREMEDLLERFWGEGEGLFGRGVPALNLSETENSVDVTMDLPGVKPEEIDIQVHGNQLTIRGERKEEQEEKGRTFHRVERSSGSFLRTVTLPCAVEESEAAAECREGILSVHLPKAEEAKTRKIQVKG